MTLVPSLSLSKLVERYRDNRPDYRSAGYNETRLRREFIDPFLELLGWDVGNKEGYAEAYKHVIHEDHIKIAGTSKAPDYSFRIGSTRKFFLEAKRPAINIVDDEDSAYQLRRYAWSAKLPLSILTNFEVLAVYDCRVKPERGDKASVARTTLLTFEQYAEKWQEIESVFSLDAINKGAFDRFANDTKVRRGTATVDEDFLSEIEKWREMLARAIFRTNPELDSYQLNDAVQKTIDRIVFLRIAEDRGIETSGRLESIIRRPNIYPKLTSYFQQADERYNSGLFHFRKGDGADETLDRLTLKLKIDDRPLRDIVSNLYPPKSPYAFSVIPADILGQVYERFLGRVIYVRGRSIKIDEKPDVKKAGGVYYTPTFVVRAIVERTLGDLLKPKSVSEVAGERRPQSALRVVDPACGSGSFLIEAYQYLLDWYLAKYTQRIDEFSKGRRPRIHRIAGGVWRLTIAERRRILTTHIFGVDIDPQAVEVTKLSLLLKVLEGETADAIAAQMHLFNQRALPDLGANIRCGNSLIEEDFYGLFAARHFTKEEQHKINVFTWEKEFSEAFESDARFDVVIGNPPYGAVLLDEEKQYLLTHYPHQSYQLDSYLLFLERSISLLLKTKGRFGMIIPNPWLTNVLQTKIRNYILSETSVDEIVHFTFPVFAKAKATVDTEIVVLRKGLVAGNHPKAYVVSDVGPDNTIDLVAARLIEHDQGTWRESSTDPINIFLTKGDRILAKKIKDAGKPLGLVFKINVGMKPYQVGKGVPKQKRSDVEHRIFDADKKLSSNYRQYIRGADILRFLVAPLELRYIRYGEWLAEPRPAANFDAAEKIVMRQTGDSLTAATDRSQFICMNNMHVLVPNESGRDLRGGPALRDRMAAWLRWILGLITPPISPRLPA
jgi:hypothetical protein